MNSLAKLKTTITDEWPDKITSAYIFIPLKEDRVELAANTNALQSVKNGCPPNCSVVYMESKS